MVDSAAALLFLLVRVVCVALIWSLAVMTAEHYNFGGHVGRFESIVAYTAQLALFSMFFFLDRFTVCDSVINEAMSIESWKSYKDLALNDELARILRIAAGEIDSLRDRQPA